MVVMDMIMRALHIVFKFDWASVCWLKNYETILFTILKLFDVTIYDKEVTMFCDGFDYYPILPAIISE